MEIEKILINEDKFKYNLKFYFWLKNLTKTKFTKNQLDTLLLNLTNQEKKFHVLENFASTLKSKTKEESYYLLISNIEDSKDVELFTITLKFYLIKDILLKKAKTQSASRSKDNTEEETLSLSYDEKSTYMPYATRVNSALIALLFFEKLKNNQIYSLNFSKIDIDKLKEYKIEANQIFMLMFSESMNQSIISCSGNNYEERVFNAFIKIGIPAERITKTHDKSDKSTEFDLFFDIDGRTFGVGAKRTLRERYKQFIKTAITSNIDVMIEITLGVDLNEEKAKTITNHGTVIMIADEIYQNRSFLKNMRGVYSVKDLSLEFLKSL